MPWSEHVYQYDGQGNTTALVDETSTVTDTFTYDAWGNEVARTGTTETPFRWNGRVGYYWDGPEGHYYVRARTYSPLSIRWLTVDPLKFKERGSAYVMCRNNPINRFDASGRISIKWVSDNANKDNPNRVECGSPFLEIQWKFLLSKPAICDGYFVQEVLIRSKEDNCPCNIPSPPNEYEVVFWEAWEVEKGSRTTMSGGKEEPYTDRVAERAKEGTCGHYFSSGTVKFFCKNVDESTNGRGIKDLGGYYRDKGEDGAKDWGLGLPVLHGQKLAPGMPTTLWQPPWWHDPSEDSQASNFAQMDWCCCSGGKKQVTASLSPTKEVL